jgi:hypothetical protein
MSDKRAYNCLTCGNQIIVQMEDDAPFPASFIKCTEKGCQGMLLSGDFAPADTFARFEGFQPKEITPELIRGLYIDELGYNDDHRRELNHMLEYIMQLAGSMVAKGGFLLRLNEEVAG